VFVTNNRRDFLKLYAGEDLHPGLVIIVPGGLVSEDQVRLFGLAIDAIAAAGDIVNKVVEVEADETVRILAWPPKRGT
jgi:hypothetical protein